ncbi:hypothetical protein L208DRAFT_1416144 [Tricholoma matsutake]|nr:hypothetical protein L208DRAFT_1416144 [Tricholoma matsutake 945]
MANKAGAAGGYFVICVTIRTATTIGLVSGSWNITGQSLLFTVSLLASVDCHDLF